MDCFTCVVEAVQQQKFERREAVTQYRGTPLCAVHAKQLWEELEEDKVRNQYATEQLYEKLGVK